MEIRLEAQMCRYQDGDIQAFDALHRALAEPLRAYLCSLTRDRIRADDLLQETFLQIHRSRASYRRDRPVRPWAFGVARYVFLMDRRSRHSRPRDALRESAEFDRPTTELFEDSIVVREALGRRLDYLTEAQREALLLHHVWGYSFGEIAERLGIHVSTAKVRAHRGVARLRDAYGRGKD